MGERSAPKLKRFLPHAVLATAVVIVLPIALVSLLSSARVIDSMIVSGLVAMLISLGLSAAGSAWWKKRLASHDLVFSDLMIWGWVRRLRTERRLTRAVKLLGTDSDVPRDRQITWFEELVGALEARDPYTHGHSRRVTAHAVAIAQRMGLSPEQVAKVRTAAAIHDIGKLHTPREVLNKPGRLTDEEFEVIKRHPVDGAEMAEALGDNEIIAMIRHHHERLDGTGYPDRLSGDEIPLGARIIAVADTFDAITSKRPYRGASSHNKGLTILAKEAGTQLDPDAVRAFSSHYSDRRGVAVGSLVTSLPGRLIPWDWGFGSAASLTKGAAALAVAGLLGGSAAGLAKPLPTHPVRRASLAADAFSHPAGRVDPRSTSPAHPSPAAIKPPAYRKTAAIHRRSAAANASSGRDASAPVAGGAPGSSSPGNRTSPGGGSSSSGGGSSSSDGQGSSPGVSTPSVKVGTPSVKVSTPSATVNTPLGTVSVHSVTVTTPSVTVSTPQPPTLKTVVTPVTKSSPSVTVAATGGTPQLP